MPLFLLSLLGGIGSIGKALVSWLSKLSLSQLACVVLLAVCIVQYIVHTADKRHAAKVERQLVKCGEQTKALTDQLHEISTKRDAQKIVTQDRIKTVIRTIHDADVQAQKVEQAPPAPDCHHDTSMRGADL